MVRVKTNVARKKRIKRVLKRAKGAWGDRSKRYRHALDTLAKGMVYAYRDRKAKKRQFRSLWVVRINAACREHGVTYSKLISALKQNKINLDRKSLAELAVRDSAAFNKLVEIAKS
ncbi:MAG: 50S ribosomal protein L20 [Candidatus Omnitrophota bacterium]